MIKSLNEDTALKFQNLNAEEKAKRGILGRLYGPVATFKAPTRNGRTYGQTLWEKLFESPLIKERFKNGGIFGQLCHPDYSEVDMEKIAVVMPEPPVKDKSGNLIAYLDIIDTPCGRIAYQLAKYGYKFGISSRGEGDLITDYDGNESVDPDTYTLSAFDLVEIPAVENARLAFVESLDKKLYNKTLRESLQNSLEKANEADRKIMEEALEDLNINLVENINNNQELDEAVYKVQIIISVIDTDTDERIATYEVNNRAKAFEFINKHPERQLVLRYERWIDGKFDSSQLLARRATTDDVIKYYTYKSNKKVNLYINGKWISRTTPEDEIYTAMKDPWSVVLVGFGSKITEDLDINTLLEAWDSLNDEEENLTDFNPDSIVDDLTNYFSHGWDLNTAEKSLQLVKQFGSISQEQFEEILNNIRTNLGQNSIEGSENDSDKNLDIDGVIQDDAVDNNEVLVNELQESLKCKQELEQKLINLQEKLSVCYAKEAKSEEEAVKYKETVRKLAEDSKKANALQAKVSLLEEKLNETKEKVEDLKVQLNESKEKVKFTAQKNLSLKESISQRGEETIKLNESIKSLQKELNKLKEAKNSNEAEIKTLKESYATKFKKLSDEGKSKEAELQKTISGLNENLESQKRDYSQKLEKSNKLIEKYKKAASIAVDKYIESQAVRLGSSVNEIKNRLPESYTFNDIDKACGDLQQYNLNMSKLPFSNISRKSVNENLKIKGMSSKNESILPAHTGFDDDIDDDLMYLAGK